MIKKDKKALAAIIMAGSVSLMAGSFAWLTKDADVTNKFLTGDKTYDAVLMEKFNDWEEFREYGASTVGNKNQVVVDEAYKPGDTNKKEVKFKNTGDYEEYIRIKVTPKLMQKQGNDYIPIDNSLDKTLGGEDAPIMINNWNTSSFNFMNDSNDWQYNSKDGYYYYKYVFSPGAETPLILNSVTFNPQAGNDHQKLIYDLSIELETVQTSEGNASLAEFPGVDSVILGSGNSLSWTFK